MPNVVTKEFRHHNAEQFFEAFSEASPTTMYFFISRPQAWSNDSSPPTPSDTVNNTLYDSWRDMLIMKKISPSDISYVSDRYDWETGTLYSMYTSDNDQMDANNYFVFTEDYNVYKCMFNNNGSGSTIKPSGTSNTVFETADGYKWKYMYTISASKAVNFLTSNYIPVQTLSADDTSIQWDIQQSAVNGSIKTITVNSGGTAYSGSNGTLQSGNSTVAILESGASSLDDEYVNSVIYISGGTGTGQLKEIVNYDGTSKTATVNSTFSTPPDGSSTYIVGPKITINGDGSGAVAYSGVAANSVSIIDVISVGQNYSWADVAISANNGTSATATAHLSPINGHGSDATKELQAHNVMVNVKLEGDESNTVFVDNDFRVIGIVTDPVLSSNTLQVANESVYNMTTQFDLTSISGTFHSDESIIGGSSSANGYMVEQTGTNMYVSGLFGEFSNGETITGQTSSATATITSITEPSIAKYKGNILYRENRSPISRASDQTEDLKIVIRF